MSDTLENLDRALVELALRPVTQEDDPVVAVIQLYDDNSCHYLRLSEAPQFDPSKGTILLSEITQRSQIGLVQRELKHLRDSHAVIRRYLDLQGLVDEAEVVLREY